MALASELAPPSTARTVGVVTVAALGAAAAGVLTRFFPVTVVAAAVAGFGIVLLISLNPMAAVPFLALTRAALEGLQGKSIVKPGGVGVSPTDVLSMAFLGGAALWLLAQARAGNRFWRHPIALWAFAVLGLSTLTLAYSPDAILGAKDLVKWSAAFAVFLVVTAVRPDPRRLRRLLCFIVAGATFPIVLGGWQFLHTAGRIVALHGGLRVQATFIHPNDYGAYLVSVAVAVWGLRPMVSGWARKFVNLIGIATVASLMLTLSRSAWVGFGIVLLVVGWRYRGVLVAAAVGAGGIVLAFPRIFGRATDALQTSTSSAVTKAGAAKAGNSVQARFSIWSGEIKAWEQRPFLGHGWGYTYSSQSQGSHNDYLRLLVEGGVVGLIAFLGLMITIVRTSVRAARGRTDLPLVFLGLTLAYVAESATLNLFAKEAYQFYFWLLAAISYVWAETVLPQADRGAPAPSHTSEATV